METITDPSLLLLEVAALSRGNGHYSDRPRGTFARSLFLGCSEVYRGGSPKRKYSPHMPFTATDELRNMHDLLMTCQ
jgi:hypothetical protein